MKERLKERIETFSKSLDKAHFLDRARLIQRFIEDELSARDAEYTVTPQDLQLIQDYAIRENLSSTTKPNDSNQMAMWWTLGVCNWLRSRNMLYFKLGGQNGVHNDQEPDNSD